MSKYPQITFILNILHFSHLDAMGKVLLNDLWIVNGGGETPHVPAWTQSHLCPKKEKKEINPPIDRSRQIPVGIS